MGSSEQFEDIQRQQAVQEALSCRWCNQWGGIHSFFWGGSSIKLNVKAFALTCGLVFGFGLFFLTWWVIAFDGATGEATFIGRIYGGYSVSAGGSFIGFVWAFFDWLIGGAFFAWLYNILAGRFSK